MVYHKLGINVSVITFKPPAGCLAELLLLVIGLEKRNPLFFQQMALVDCILRYTRVIGLRFVALER